MKAFKTVVPTTFAAACGAWRFSPAVVVNGVVHVSGQVGVDPRDLSVPPDLETQIANIFTAIETILADASATPADIFSLTSYHVGDLEKQMPVFTTMRADFLGSPDPAWTAIGVNELALPGVMIEVAALAVVPG